MTCLAALGTEWGGQKAQDGGQTIGPPVGPNNLRSYLALTRPWATAIEYVKGCSVTSKLS